MLFVIAVEAYPEHGSSAALAHSGTSVSLGQRSFHALDAVPPAVALSTNNISGTLPLSACPMTSSADQSHAVSPSVMIAASRPLTMLRYHYYMPVLS